MCVSSLHPKFLDLETSLIATSLPSCSVPTRPTKRRRTKAPERACDDIAANVARESARARDGLIRGRGDIDAACEGCVLSTRVDKSSRHHHHELRSRNTDAAGEGWVLDPVPVSLEARAGRVMRSQRAMQLFVRQSHREEPLSWTFITAVNVSSRPTQTNGSHYKQHRWCQSPVYFQYAYIHCPRSCRVAQLICAVPFAHIEGCEVARYNSTVVKFHEIFRPA